MAETTYVRHHKQKIAFILSAMRHFADGAARGGRAGRLCRPRRSGQQPAPSRASSPGGRAASAGARRRHRARRVARLGDDAAGWPRSSACQSRFCRTTASSARARISRAGPAAATPPRMELFYREMRKAHRPADGGGRSPTAASGTTTARTASALPGGNGRCPALAGRAGRDDPRGAGAGRRALRRPFRRPRAVRLSVTARGCAPRRSTISCATACRSSATTRMR